MNLVGQHLTNKPLNIGFFFWGFLTDPSDSPDGAGLERFYFIRELQRRGHCVKCIGVNRDALENANFLGVERLLLGHRKDLEKIEFISVLEAFSSNLDLLIIEWRWPILGRSTKSDRDKPEYTPDVEIQEKLLAHFAYNERIKGIIPNDPQFCIPIELRKHGALESAVPIYIWDTDLHIGVTDFDLWSAQYKLLMPCQKPCFSELKDQPFWHTLFWPYDYVDLKKQFEAHFSNWKSNLYSLVYIGNNYHRDEMIERYVWPVAQKEIDVHFVGNWNKYPDKFEQIKSRWPQINYHPRVGRDRFCEFYGRAYSTILLVPQNYLEARAIGTRFCQALAWATIPFCPAEYKPLADLLPPFCVVEDWQDLAHKIEALKEMDVRDVRAIFDDCLRVALNFDTPHIVDRFLEIHNGREIC